jgi:hypothetical protein
MSVIKSYYQIDIVCYNWNLDLEKYSNLVIYIWIREFMNQNKFMIW